jgi:biotin synthase-related radical SAM superfamily protein
VFVVISNNDSFLFQVHKVTIDKVANSIPGRGNIELEIYGMEGIPEKDMIEHEKQKQTKGTLVLKKAVLRGMECT